MNLRFLRKITLFLSWVHRAFLLASDLRFLFPRKIYSWGVSWFPILVCWWLPRRQKLLWIGGQIISLVSVVLPCTLSLPLPLACSLSLLSLHLWRKNRWVEGKTPSEIRRKISVLLHACFVSSSFTFSGWAPFPTLSLVVEKKGSSWNSLSRESKEEPKCGWIVCLGSSVPLWAILGSRTVPAFLIPTLGLESLKDCFSPILLFRLLQKPQDPWKGVGFWLNPSISYLSLGDSSPFLI